MRYNFFGFDYFSVANLPRKAFALLAYLALEGRVLKRQVAGLLWVGKPDAVNNLAKLRAEINKVLGADAIITNGKFLALGAIDSDLLEWRSAGAARRWELYAGELLRGFALPEWSVGRGEEFQEWLEGQRRGFALQRIEAGLDLVLEKLGRSEFASALPYLSVLATDRFDPREVALRWWLLVLGVLGKTDSLHGNFRAGKAALELIGEVVSARTLAAYDLAMAKNTKACLQLLQSELSSLSQKQPLPSKVLFGRETECKRMEAAWTAGQIILISGVSGVGKTHLALEFAQSKGNVWRFPGRPSDQFVPYALHARNYGWVFQKFPDFSVPDWVRLEMSRLIPNLGGVPAPMVTPEDKLRFFEAQAETFVLACQQLQFATMFIDDAQFTDEASAQAGMYLHSKMLPYQDGFARTIFAFRAGGFAPQIEQSLRAWVDQGIAIWIDLEPLSEAAVGQCLAAISPKLEPLHKSIMAYTGGNPMLVTETARWLLEQDDFTSLSLPRSQRAASLTQARLLPLSEDALLLLRLAAIMDGYFDLEAAQRVLGWSTSKLQSQVQILEQAHLLQANQFTHDLILEAVLNSIPAEILVSLHGLALQILELQGALAAKLLIHAQAAGHMVAIQKYLPQADAEARALMV